MDKRMGAQFSAALSKRSYFVGALLFLLLRSTWCLGEDIRAREWIWNVDDPDLPYAATANSAGNLLAQFCVPSDGNCFYAVSLGIDCDEGDEYTALANTKGGATTVDLVCGTEHDEETGAHAFVFQDFGEIDDLVRTYDRIAFAVAMRDGEFKAVRFSLDGSNQALDLMRKAAERLGEQTIRKSKDSHTF